MQAFAEVDQIQNILLEARSTETNRRLEDLVSNPGIVSDGMSNLVNVGSRGLTNG
jgi:hypothetical protein